MSSDTEVVIDVAESGVSAYAISLFASGHPRDAIRHETQDLLNELQERTERDDLDGYDLVGWALNDKNPILAFNERSTMRERDEHSALRLLLMGVTRGVRNRYSHDVRAEVTREEAAIWLGLLGRLRGQLEQTYRVSLTPESEPED